MSDASPRASRLATPSWLDVRLVLGVVLVLVSVVAGARVFAAADHYTEVYLARSALVPGERLHAGDLGVGEIRFAGEGSSYVAASSDPVGYVVTRYVGPGELVPADALSPSTSTATTSRLVTVPVEPGHLPDDLGHGDLVDVYVTAKGGIGRRATPPTKVLGSVPVDSFDDGSSLSGGDSDAVVLVVPGSDVEAIVQAVESGSIDLVRVPDAAVAAAAMPSPS